MGDTNLQAQNEFIQTFEEMSRAVMSRATAEIELGVRLTQRLSEAHIRFLMSCRLIRSGWVRR